MNPRNLRASGMPGSIEWKFVANGVRKLNKDGKKQRTEAIRQQERKNQTRFRQHRTLLIKRVWFLWEIARPRASLYNARI
jgi:hypothetical protein